MNQQQNSQQNSQQNPQHHHPLTHPHTSQWRQTTRTTNNQQPQTGQSIKLPLNHSHSPHPHNPANQKTDPTNRAPIAANACHQDVMDVNNIAVTPAEVPPTDNEDVTLANSKCNAPCPCHTGDSGKFAVIFNPDARFESLLPNSPAYAPDLVPNSGQPVMETAVSAPSQAGLPVTGVTLATSRRHTATNEPSTDAAQQATHPPSDCVTPDTTSPSDDIETVVSAPSQAGLPITGVTLATSRRHTATNEPPDENITQHPQADSPTLPIASADVTESDNDDDDDDPLRSCKYCGEPFEPRSVRHKYCSNVCRVYAHYLRHGGRKCKVCGQPTPLPSRSVCSEACRAQLPYYRPGCYDELPTAPSEE